MSEAETRMTTYKLADGDLVAGEHGWVTELDYFDEDFDPVELIEEVWIRASTRTFWQFPASAYCYGDGEDDINCNGDEQWVNYDQQGWMYLCAAHRDHVAALHEEDLARSRVSQ